MRPEDSDSEASSARAAAERGPSDGAGIAARASDSVSRHLDEPLAPGLYLVATPIGNLGDITLRALSVLGRADVIYCEDTRHSRILLQHFAIKARLEAYHEHNAAEQRPRILSRLDKGQRVALISDAGTPLISDPGFKLAREAAAAGHAVVSLPGASAGITALTSSGLPADAFLFAGFLPPKSAARQTRLKDLAAVPGTLIFYEAPQRLSDSLADMSAVLGDRPAVVARELTKLHEDIVRGSLSELAQAHGGRDIKGELVVLVGPPIAGAASDEALRSALGAALRDMTLRDAAKAVAEALGVPRSRVYDLGLAMKRETPA
jgi:16S rRNA (cytidine1402-2'-O)-methyltransferase